MARSLPYAEDRVKRNLCDMQRMCVHKAEMSSVAERLREARIRAGFTTAAEAARRLNVPYGTYSGHENGARGVKKEEALRYAKVFRVSSGWLLFGETDGVWQHVFINCIGHVGRLADGEFEYIGEDEDEFIMQNPLLAFDKEAKKINTQSDKLAFVTVDGPNARGIAVQGSILICLRDFAKKNTNYDGDLNLCKLKDGKIFLRYVVSRPNSDKFDLEGPLFQTIRDAEVESFSEVRSIMLPPAVKAMKEDLARLGRDLQRASGRNDDATED